MKFSRRLPLVVCPRNWESQYLTSTCFPSWILISIWLFWVELLRLLSKEITQNSEFCIFVLRRSWPKLKFLSCRAFWKHGLKSLIQIFCTTIWESFTYWEEWPYNFGLYYTIKNDVSISCWLWQNFVT